MLGKLTSCVHELEGGSEEYSESLLVICLTLRENADSLCSVSGNKKTQAPVQGPTDTVVNELKSNPGAKQM